MNEIELNTIMDRISVSSPESPISVFKCEGGLKAVFGRTRLTEFWIKQGTPYYIGTFDGSYNPHSVHRILVSASL